MLNVTTEHLQESLDRLGDSGAAETQMVGREYIRSLLTELIEHRKHRVFVRSGDVPGGTQQEGWLDLTHLQTVVGEWSDRTFPKSSGDSIMAHFLEEAGEFAGPGSETRGFQEEAADCTLLLLHFAHKMGFSLMDAVGAKFRKNTKRKWATEANAGGYFKHTDGE